MSRHYPRGLDNRQRDQNGEIRRKRGDTLVRTLRQEYGLDFAADYRADARLDTVLQREQADSLRELLNRPKP
jgi:hypothetical protein